MVEKTSTGLYKDKMSEISTRVIFPKLHGGKDVQMENAIDVFTNFLNAAPNSGERERMKHLMASSYNMSARRAHTFGMSNLRKRAEKVESEAEKIRAIKNKHLHFAKIEQKVYLQSIGRPYGYLSSSSSESEHSEDEEDKDMIPDEINNERPLDIPHGNSENLSLEAEANHVHVDQPLQCNDSENQPSSTQLARPSSGSDRGERNVPHLDVNSVVLDILREVEWNWFSFVVLLEPKFEKQGYSQEVFDQFLVDFASQLPNLGLSDDEFNLVEQSRGAFLSEVAQKEARVEEIVHELDSDDGDAYGGANGGLGEAPDESEIQRKLKLMKDKGKRLAKSEIELKGLYGRRKSTERASFVLVRHPDIGEVMENTVREADVGGRQMAPYRCVHIYR